MRSVDRPTVCAAALDVRALELAGPVAEAALNLRRLAAVAAQATWPPIRPIPEQTFVAFVSDDVVDQGSQREAAVRANAIAGLRQECPASRSPCR
jgi:hypothetical protein